MKSVMTYGRLLPVCIRCGRSILARSLSAGIEIDTAHIPKESVFRPPRIDLQNRMIKRAMHPSDSRHWRTTLCLGRSTLARSDTAGNAVRHMQHCIMSIHPTRPLIFKPPRADVAGTVCIGSSARDGTDQRCTMHIRIRAILARSDTAQNAVRLIRLPESVCRLPGNSILVPPRKGSMQKRRLMRFARENISHWRTAPSRHGPLSSHRQRIGTQSLCVVSMGRIEHAARLSVPDHSLRCVMGWCKGAVDRRGRSASV